MGKSENSKNKKKKSVKIYFKFKYHSISLELYLFVYYNIKKQFVSYNLLYLFLTQLNASFFFF